MSIGSAAAGVAAQHAAEVDREARFPIEAVTALRAKGLLAAGIPADLGGGGLSLADLAAVARALGQACSASAAVFVTHQVEVARLARCAPASAAIRAVLDRVVAEGWLLGSAASGGNTLRDAAEASISSFTGGGYADAIVVTHPRGAGEARVDVAVHARAELTLEPGSVPDQLGYRGVSGPEFRVMATGTAVIAEQVDADEAATWAAHILWAASWVGLTSRLVMLCDRALQSAASKNDGVARGGARGAELHVVLCSLEALLTDGLRHAAGEFRSPESAMALNSLAIRSSELVVEAARRSLSLLGMAGYANDSPVSVARQVRDALGAPLVLDNAGLLNRNAGLILELTHA